MADNKEKKERKPGDTDSGFAKSPEKKNKENGLEFLIVTRETYRTPEDLSRPVRVRIKNQRFPVLNMSRRGIGFLVPEPGIFEPGEILDPVTVVCGKERIVLKARVVHITPCEAEAYLCGIEVLQSNRRSLDRIEAYLESNRRTLFSKQ